MEVVLILIGALLMLWVMYLIAKEFYKAAEAKGYAEKKYLWLCFLLGAVGYLLVVALPDRGSKAASNLDDLPML